VFVNLRWESRPNGGSPVMVMKLNVPLGAGRHREGAQAVARLNSAVLAHDPRV
jgi:hypothetical protein